MANPIQKPVPTSTPDPKFRSIYAKDGKGHDFSSTYKHSTSSPPNLTNPPFSFTRATYAKDSRGHDLSDSYKYVEESRDQASLRSVSTASYSTGIVGDDGLPRGPYDLGQRVRSVSYFTNGFRSASSSRRPSGVESRAGSVDVLKTI